MSRFTSPGPGEDLSPAFANVIASSGAMEALENDTVSSKIEKRADPATKTQGSDKNEKKQLGVALVGLGHYSTDQLAPALQETHHCKLAGIVTGTQEKAEAWKIRFNLPDRSVYDYDSFDEMAGNEDIDVVYVVLPNALHKEFVIRAARAGKHVICEKPMALTVTDCDEMIQACKESGKRLSIGYRLHFEPHNQEMMRLGRKNVFGKIRRILAEDGLSDATGWRLDAALAGGGPLMDLGIYCIQAVRYTTGLEPIAVTAEEGVKTQPDKFKGIEESLRWQLELPGGIKAICKASYAKDLNLLRVEAEKGWFEISPAYEYQGIKGRTSEGLMILPEVFQQTRQMDDFAQAIMENRPTPVPGDMGRQDVRIIEAIYESMRTRSRVEINKVPVGIVI